MNIYMSVDDPEPTSASFALKSALRPMPASFMANGTSANSNVPILTF
jgi:hypothetical protein